MILTTIGWSNERGNGSRFCKCDSWKKHWLNSSKIPWPESCSVHDCSNTPTLGGHIINPNVTGERIVPICDSCNQLTNPFNLKGRIMLVSANRSKACDK